MKRVIACLALALGVSTLAYGQGQVSLINNSTTLIRDQNSVPITLAQNILVGLYWGASSTTVTNTVDPATWGAIGAGGLPDGRFNNGNITTTLPLDSTGFLNVVFWDGDYGTTYTSFLANPNSFSNNALTGNAAFSVFFPATPTAVGITGAGKITGPINLAPVPEPSVVALGVLGALVLLFRRRK